MTKLQELESRLEQYEIRLKESNELLRSAYQIANREGENTNWLDFKIQLSNELILQHQLMDE